MAVDFDDLLEGLDGEAREGRLALLRELHEDGCSMAELRRAVTEDRLALLPVDRVLQGEPEYDDEDLARLAGLSVEALRASRAALGLPIEADSGRIHDEQDLESARSLKTVLDTGVPLESVLELNRVVGRAMRQVAAASRAMVAEFMLRPGVSEREVGAIAARAARELVPTMRPTLAYAYQAHLRELLRSDVISAADIAAGRAAGAREMTVAFADLVGFTRMGEQVPAEELGGVVRRLEALAADVVEAPVTFVKTIGDAVMLVAPAPDALLDAACTLVAAAAEQGEEFPQLRVGVACGPALERAGDWYGSPVNQADRVTTVARPGSVLTTESVKEHAGAEWRWSFAGERRLKGVGTTKLFRARRDGDGEAG
jgi:adenylate cyclase